MRLRSLPGEVQIGDGRRPGQVSRQCRACDLVFDDVSDAGVRLLGLGGAQVAGRPTGRIRPGVFAGRELRSAGVVTVWSIDVSVRVAGRQPALCSCVLSAAPSPLI